MKSPMSAENEKLKPETFYLQQIEFKKKTHSDSYNALPIFHSWSLSQNYTIWLHIQDALFV